MMSSGEKVTLPPVFLLKAGPTIALNASSKLPGYVVATIVPAAQAERGRPPAALAARSAEPEPRSDLRVSWNMASPPIARRLRRRVCENADACRVGYDKA